MADAVDASDAVFRRTPRTARLKTYAVPDWRAI